jgi:hypothetical protein
MYIGDEVRIIHTDRYYKMQGVIKYKDYVSGWFYVAVSGIGVLMYREEHLEAVAHAISR